MSRGWHALCFYNSKNFSLSPRGRAVRTCGDGGLLPPRLDRLEWPAERACPLLDPSLGSERAADPPQPRPGILGMGSWASPFQSFPHPRGRARAAWLARQIFQDRADGNCHPWSVPRVIKQHAFYTAIGKGVKQVHVGQVLLG